MSTITDDRINSTQAKDAIYKSHTIKSTANEIDDSVNNTFKFIFGEDFYDATNEVNFLNIANWQPQINGGTTPVFDNNSSFHRYGAESLRIGEASTGDTSLFAKKINLSKSYDLSSTDIVTFWVYVDGDLVTDLASASSYGSVMFVIGDLNFVNSKGCNIFGVGGGSWHKGWNNITVNKSDFSINISGTLDWTSVQSFQIRVDAGTNNIGTLFHFDSIFVGGNSVEKIPVCITLDDSEKDSYEMATIMNQYGISTSLFVISDFVDDHATYSGYLSLSEILSLYNKGNHIGMHHQNVNGFALDKTLMLKESNWLKSNGFIRDDGHLYGSYPNGSYNQDSIDYAKSIGIKGLRSLTGIARDDSQGREATTGLIHYESISNGGIADKYRINSSKPTNVADFTNKLNTAIAKKGAYLTYHHLFSEFTNRDEWVALAKYLKTKIDDGTIECLTFPQFVKKYSN